MSRLASDDNRTEEWRQREDLVGADLGIGIPHRTDEPLCAGFFDAGIRPRGS
ncbi:hypothetical protein X772_12385 [Mesorhizobium sp. LSJC280B00]|nr:hypothetical protein X772_12385 [Mesorhizobium sp. LSJC280B00]